ncbi:MAG: hypothetical protein JRH20_29425 [Deltaproteobacteria bacterium]|nr:hypothetical protein [Deltaproteobacteria bacterium]
MYQGAKALSLIMVLSIFPTPYAKAASPKQVAKRAHNTRQRQLGKALCQKGQQEYLASKAEAAPAPKLFSRDGW